MSYAYVMAEHHVIARVHPRRQCTLPEDTLYAVPCPECGRDCEDRMVGWELAHPNTSTRFCGRWGCDALLHVRAAT